MSLKEAYMAELNAKREREEAAARPHAEAYAHLKAFFHEIMADKEFRDMVHGQIELNDDELQVDPGAILIRATVDGAGDYHLTYEIKSNDDPEIRTIEVNTIPDIEKAIAKLLVEYGDA